MASSALAPSSPVAAGTAPDAAPKPAPSHADPDSLALQVDDDIENIRNVHCACACLEKLILPQRVDETEDVHPTRSELGALMRLVNEEMHRRIDAADATIKSLRSAIQAAPRDRIDRGTPEPSGGYGWTAAGPVRIARC
ncbi:hypothetical protein QTI51_36195 [Variovorax sp. J22G73]|nr:hypothetical protein [Variovorax sp. J22R203]MDM0102768.1 hypothetical protein [Variovorax sp. J22G73]